MKVKRIQLLTAKIESTYGTDPTPTPADNAIAVIGDTLVYDFDNTFTPRKVLDGGHAETAGYMAQKRVSLKFRTEIRGNRTDGVTADISAGASAQALREHALLASCNLAATYTAESGAGVRDGYVTYKPTIPTTEGSSCTLWFYDHLSIHKVTGCKGTFEIVLDAGKPGYIEWTFNGIYNPIVDATFPTTQAFIATKAPIFLNSTTTWASYAAIFSQLRISLGNAIQMRGDALSADGLKGYLITDRASSGNFNPESVAEATHAYWANAVAETVATLSCLYGSQTGNKFQGTFTCQPTKIGYSDQNEQVVNNVQFKVLNSTLGATLGNDFQLKFF